MEVVVVAPPNGRQKVHPRRIARQMCLIRRVIEGLSPHLKVFPIAYQRQLAPPEGLTGWLV